MPEISFYHLERKSLEDVLPSLLERSLARGWRVVVECGSEERMRALDAHLWTYDDASFLPHGIAGGPFDAQQPVLLTLDARNPNAAHARFFTDRARLRLDDAGAYQRLVLVFDARDPEALTEAREDWKAARAAGLEAAYWRQDERGRWGKAG